MKRMVPLLLTVFLLLPNPLTAQVKYGDAMVMEGHLIIVRGSQETRHLAGETSLEVRKDDLLRVGESSLAQLSTIQDTKITLGSNAVLQIKPWKLRKSHGYVKMVFGKIRVKQLKVNKRKAPFRIRTAMAVIGVKGTEWDQEATTEGNVVVHTLEGTVGLQGMSGIEQDVSVGMVSAVVGGKPAKLPVQAPEAMKKSAQEGKVDAPPAGSPAAGTMSSEQSLAKSGLVSQSELDQSKTTEVKAQEDVSKAPIELVEKPDVVDPEFEQEFEESQELETEDIEVSISMVLPEAEQAPVAPVPVEPIDIDPEIPDVSEPTQQSLEKHGYINIKVEH